MKILLASSLLLLAAGCSTYSDRQAAYNSPVYSEKVVTSPGYTYTTTNYPADYYSSATPLAVVEADRSLESSIQGQLSRYGELSKCAPNLVLSAHNGVVNVSGPVSSERERQMICDAIKLTPGVVTLNDEMRLITYPTGRNDSSSRIYIAPPVQSVQTVQTVQPAPATAVAATGDMFSLHVQNLTPEDRVLGQRVLEGLRTDTVVSSIFPRVSIHVQNSQIILRGAVQNEQQRQTIVAAVQRASGTGNVVDELRITPAY